MSSEFLDEKVAVHLKLARRLLARVDACAREEGVSRPEYIRAALSASALRSEQQAGRRKRLESSPADAQGAAA